MAWDVDIWFKDGEGIMKGSRIIPLLRARELEKLALEHDASVRGDDPKRLHVMTSLYDKAKVDAFCMRLDSLDYVVSYQVQERK